VSCRKLGGNGIRMVEGGGREGEKKKKRGW